MLAFHFTPNPTEGAASWGGPLIPGPSPDPTIFDGLGEGRNAFALGVASGERPGRTDVRTLQRVAANGTHIRI